MIPDTGHPPTPVPCQRCGYLTAAALNFCPKCGLDLRAGLRTRPDPDTQGLLGQVVADRYRLVELVGEGAMGAVYRAEHVRMGKVLALKILRGAFARDPAAAQRFAAEANIVSRLSHPHTIAVFDFGEMPSGEAFYLAMEYVPGRDLQALLRESGKLPEARAISIAEQLLGSLGEAHEAGIVHRDVKPGNVMLRETRDGDFVKVLDFGIAKLRTGAADSDTAQGLILGTPNYLAPEQARGEEIDARADLYSTGAMLYEVVSGRCPFVARSPVAVVQAHLGQAPPPLRQVAPWISEGFAAVVHRALAKRPADRFPDAEEMRRALLALGGRPATASPPSRPPAPASLDLASRADFRDVERRVSLLRGSRLAAPALVLLVLAGLAVWHWSDLHAFLRRQAPGFAGAVPPALRTAGDFEREPNDTPGRANRLVLPAGSGGRSGGGAVVRGTIGPRLDATTGDVDVFRVEVPDPGRRMLLVAEWSGETPGEGIRGLDVALTLNRDRDGEGGRRSAPLVAEANRGGPGRAERLTALVEPGTYYLAVRERHREGSEPVERPDDPYRLRVFLEEPRPGEEVEPDDEPEAGGDRGYPQWKTLAERNALGEGESVEGETSPEDFDTFAVGPRRTEQVDLAVLIPAPGLALAAQCWLPAAEDLLAGSGERTRFAEAGGGGPGELVVVPLRPAPLPSSPALVRLRAAEGEGRYQILALGPGSASGAAVRARSDALAAAGRGPEALELVAAYVRALPQAAARTEVLMAAGSIAERLSAGLRPAAIRDYERASQRLGLAVFEAVDGKVRYGAAFESLAEGRGRLAEEALLLALRRALPCTAGEVERRAQTFLARFPGSERAAAARLELARALEEEHWQSGAPDALRRAIREYRLVAGGAGPGAEEARQRARDLSRARPERPAVPRIRCE